jgi:hypothetical protein
MRCASTVLKMHAAVLGPRRPEFTFNTGMNVRGRFTGLSEVLTGSAALPPAGGDGGGAPGEREG